jgi:hypothetical protein
LPTMRVLKSNPSQATTIFSSRSAPFLFDSVSGNIFERAAGDIAHRSNVSFASQNSFTPTHAVSHMARVGTTGGVLIGGTTPSNTNRARLTQLSTTNAAQWTEDIMDTGFARHTPVAQIIGFDNELYDTGYTVDTPSLALPYLNRISNAGALVWSTRLDMNEVTDVACGNTLVFVTGKAGGVPVVAAYQRATGVLAFIKNLTTITDTAGVAVGVAAGPTDNACAIVGNFGTMGNLRMKMILLKPDQTELSRVTLGAMGEVAKQIETDFDGRYFAVSESGSAFCVQDTGVLNWSKLVNGRYGRIAVEPNSSDFWIVCQPNVGNFFPSWRFERTSRANGVVNRTFETPQAGEFLAVATNGAGELLASINNPGNGGASRLMHIYGPAEQTFGLAAQSLVYAAWSPTGQPFGIGLDSDNPNVTKTVSVCLLSGKLQGPKVTPINPPGIGLDSKPVNALTAFNGTLWTIATMERRGQGRVVLYSRWRIDDEAPIATEDTYSLKKGTTNGANGPGVLFNDYDLNGDAITAELVTPPTLGTLTINANGSYTYTAPNVAGTQIAFYRCRDANGKVSNVSSLTITVTN